MQERGAANQAAVHRGRTDLQHQVVTITQRQPVLICVAGTYVRTITYACAKAALTEQDQRERTAQQVWGRSARKSWSGRPADPQLRARSHGARRASSSLCQAAAVPQTRVRRCISQQHLIPQHKYEQH